MRGSGCARGRGHLRATVPDRGAPFCAGADRLSAVPLGTLVDRGECRPIQVRIRGGAAGAAVPVDERPGGTATGRPETAPGLLRRLRAGVRSRPRRGALRIPARRRRTVGLRTRRHFLQQRASRRAAGEIRARRGGDAGRGPRARVQHAAALDPGHRVGRVGAPWRTVAEGLPHDGAQRADQPDRGIDHGGIDLRACRRQDSGVDRRTPAPARRCRDPAGALRAGHGLVRIRRAAGMARGHRHHGVEARRPTAGRLGARATAATLAGGDPGRGPARLARRGRECLPDVARVPFHGRSRRHEHGAFDGAGCPDHTAGRSR